MQQAAPKYIVSILLISLCYILGYELTQKDFYPLASVYGAFFLLYLLIYHQAKDAKTVYFFIGLAILLRFLLVFSMPNLSDDIYRFIWDGRLINNGINPFNQLPSYYLDQELELPGISPKLYSYLNSKTYFTIYPPVCQAVFAFSCFIFPMSISASTLMMKLIFFAFECGSILLIIALLKNFNLPIKQALLYALNPLIILEICGNLHFEGAMIFFLLLAYYLLVKQKISLSAVAMALSIASKLLPFDSF